MATKRLILAVAGSGKTRYLVENLNEHERILIVSFTNTCVDLIKRRIISKFGFLPGNIRVYTYFEFLYGFCVKPFTLKKYRIKGIIFDPPPDFTTYLPNSDINKYISTNRYLYSSRLAKFIEFENIIEGVQSRLSTFFDHFFFDEFQDLGGHDFNLILQLAQANTNCLFVGDFYQNTYVTSFDGKVNMNLYSNLDDYCNRIKRSGITVDIQSLLKSYRCSPTICEFVRVNLGIRIESHREDVTKIVYLTDPESIESILKNSNIVKLVYDRSNETSFYSKNWGECKGEDDYDNTCIVLNDTTSKLFAKGKLQTLAARTKNKLYVALTRTKGDCFLIDNSHIKKLQ